MLNKLRNKRVMKTKMRDKVNINTTIYYYSFGGGHKYYYVLLFFLKKNSQSSFITSGKY